MRLPYVLITWVALLVLLAVEFFSRHTATGATMAPFIGMAMALIVAMTFMRLPFAPGVACAFALAGVFWLGIMMGMGSLDPMTRHDIAYPVQTEH